MRKILWWLNIVSAFCLGLSYLATIVPPQVLKWIPLFGLTYPVWVIIQFVFLGYWLFIKKRKKAILPLGILLLGWNIHAGFFQPYWGSENTDNGLKILTYNVRLFDYYKWLEGATTKDKIYNTIKEENPDILCFQEFFYDKKEGDYKTREAIMSYLKMPYFQEKFTHKLDENRYFGIITFSKFPIVYQGEIHFETDDNNFCIYSDIVKGKDTIRVYNTHLSSIRFQKEDYEYIKHDKEGQDNVKNTKRIASRLITAYQKRESQTKKVLTSVGKSPYPVILCGDFNDTPVSYCYHEFNKVLIDSFKEKGFGIASTYIGKFPSFRIDYVFHSPEFKCVDYEVKNIHLSDHKPLVLVLKELN